MREALYVRLKFVKQLKIRMSLQELGVGYDTIYRKGNIGRKYQWVFFPTVIAHTR